MRMQVEGSKVKSLQVVDVYMSLWKLELLCLEPYTMFEADQIS
jgi:hypothetical protein